MMMMMVGVVVVMVVVMMVVVEVVNVTISIIYFSGIERLGHEGRKDMGRLGSWMQPHIDRIGEQVGQVR